MLKAWQTNLTNTGYTAATHALHPMCLYFEQQAMNDPYIEEKDQHSKFNNYGRNDSKNKFHNNKKVAMVRMAMEDVVAVEMVPLIKKITQII